MKGPTLRPSQRLDGFRADSLRGVACVSALQTAGPAGGVVSAYPRDRAASRETLGNIGLICSLLAVPSAFASSRPVKLKGCSEVAKGNGPSHHKAEATKTSSS